MAAIEWMRAVPVAPAKNIAAALAFYRDKLGFTQAFDMGNYVGIVRGPIEIHLFDASMPAPDGGKLNSAQSIRIDVKGIDDLYAGIDPSIVKADARLETKPWGVRQFSVVDPAGNRITFA
jgi:catechol 2,3-dioxygenase-like lactoylglutathione lyase family enzyme